GDLGRVRLMPPVELARIEIPGPHGPVLAGRGDVPALRMQNDGVDLGAAFEGGFEHLARRRVPELEPAAGRIIAGPRNQSLAVAEEFQAADFTIVFRECERRSPRGRCEPELDRVILPARDGELAVGAERDAARVALVPMEVGEWAAGGD